MIIGSTETGEEGRDDGVMNLVGVVASDVDHLPLVVVMGVRRNRMKM